MRFFAKYASASKWEESRNARGTGRQRLPVPDRRRTRVVSNITWKRAASARQTFKLNVVDLPSREERPVTYHYPAWSGLKDVTEDPGGDLRAVEGTIGEVAIDDR